MKVYVLSKRGGVAHKIVGIFSSPKKAEEYMAAVPDNYNMLEIHTLNPNTNNLVTKGYNFWTVLMRKNGTVEKIEKLDDYDHKVSSFIYGITDPFFPAEKHLNVVLYSIILAKSKEQAIKISNKIRENKIKGGEWKE